jgi:peptidoglycan/xylan/chitin deacetylase (PgdA/CDA1 family)
VVVTLAPEKLEALRRICSKYGVNATFFVVGDWAEKYPESVKALYDAGNEVMSHSNKHKHMPALSKADIIADLTACNARIAAVTGVTPTLFRPPYGDYNDTLITAVSEMEMKTIQWDVELLECTSSAC